LIAITFLLEIICGKRDDVTVACHITGYYRSLWAYGFWDYGFWAYGFWDYFHLCHVESSAQGEELEGVDWK
jgi:hypothetical protein